MMAIMFLGVSFQRTDSFAKPRIFPGLCFNLLKQHGIWHDKNLCDRLVESPSPFIISGWATPNYGVSLGPWVSPMALPKARQVLKGWIAI
jgi:hypothetical protein